MKSKSLYSKWGQVLGLLWPNFGILSLILTLGLTSSVVFAQGDEDEEYDGECAIALTSIISDKEPNQVELDINQSIKYDDEVEGLLALMRDRLTAMKWGFVSINLDESGDHIAPHFYEQLGNQLLKEARQIPGAKAYDLVKNEGIEIDHGNVIGVILDGSKIHLFSGEADGVVFHSEDPLQRNVLITFVPGKSRRDTGYGEVNILRTDRDKNKPKMPKDKSHKRFSAYMRGVIVRLPSN